MTKTIKITLIALAVLLAFAVLSALLLSRVDTKSRFEALASDATGLTVTVNGSIAVRLFPIPHVALRQVTLSNQEAQIVAVDTADVAVELWPLLRRQVRITRMSLEGVSIAIERDRSGHLDSAKSTSVKRLVPAMSLGQVSLTKLSFRYTNQEFSKEFSATGCDLVADKLQLAEGDSADIIRNLSFAARATCTEMRNNLFVGTEVHFSVASEQGRFKITPLTMEMLGGKGTGNIDADFTGAVPVFQVHYIVTHLKVVDLFKSFAPTKAGEGLLDFSADLSMRGFDAKELTQTANGEASLRGENIELAIGNLDEKLAHYESSQNFNLIDVGAFLVAGPLGTAVTKGYDFAGIFRGAEGNTQFRVFLSQWKVENGIAHAQDVAMATKENRLAMKGALNFVAKEFENVSFAFVDSRGCAMVEQKVVGPFSKPVITKPNVLVSMTGPVANLIGKVKKAVGMKCDVFYEGSIAPI